MRAARFPAVRLRPGAALTLAGVLLLLALLLGVGVGAQTLAPTRVLEVLLHPSEGTDSLVVWTLRLPRALVAALAGAALGVSGGLLQGVTRNPLADPGILGVEAGASLAVLLVLVFAPGLTALLVPLAFVGGLAAAAVALTITAGVGFTPLRLALAGVTVASLAAATTRALLVLFEQRAQGALFSLQGTLVNRGWPALWQLLPWTAVGLLAAFLLAGRVNLLALGEDVARSLGARARRDAALVSAVGVLLAASAVSVVGPVGFVGLLAPHAARALSGPDHRRNLPLAALLGAALLPLADAAARLVNRPAEVPVGILIAVLGAPFFVLVARRLRRADT